MKTKKGISLIVLVITIIVLAILAATVIISITNSGIINNSKNAVKEHDLAEVRSLASLAWGEALMQIRTEADTDYQSYVENYLTNSGVDIEKYVVSATESGVSVDKAVEFTLTLSCGSGIETYNYKVKEGTTVEEWIISQDPQRKLVWDDGSVEYASMFVIDEDGTVWTCSSGFAGLGDTIDGAVILGGGGPMWYVDGTFEKGPYIFPDTVIMPGDAYYTEI